MLMGYLGNMKIGNKLYTNLKRNIMLIEKIDELLSETLKKQDTIRLSVLRAIKNEFLKYKTAKNVKPLDEPAEVQILKKMAAQREESIEMFKAGGREDLVLKETSELDVLREYLPAEVGREEILAALDDWMKTNILEKKTMGVAIKYIKQTLPMADGKLTSDIVKERIG
jgi:uncharacterized protein YqeY